MFLKEYLDIDDLNLIRKELTVKPFVPKTSLASPPSFAVYRESKRKIYLPKFYGLENYGEPEANITPDGVNIKVDFAQFFDQLRYLQNINELQSTRESARGRDKGTVTDGCSIFFINQRAQNIDQGRLTKRCGCTLLLTPFICFCYCFDH